MVSRSFQRLMERLVQSPQAIARVEGSDAHPDISGTVSFYQTDSGVLVAASVSGLPKREEGGGDGIFGFHIHGGAQCEGNEEDPFADALTHYDPQDRPHPYHAGDLPPLFGNDGYACQVFLTNRFTVQEVLDRTVIIHSAPDDFTSQPGGNAGQKIACGPIRGVGG